METDIKSVLLQTKAEILQRLVDLAPREVRSEALRLVSQLTQADQILATVSPPGEDVRYVRTMYAIDAIKLYLTELGHSAPREEIVREVARRGFRRPQTGSLEQTIGNVKKSLKMYLDGQASNKPELREIGNLVGLANWPDHRFFPVA